MKCGCIAVVVVMASSLSTVPVAAQDGMEEESAPPTITGFRPVSATTTPQAGEVGMGTPAAERERMRRSIGDVGQSVRQRDEEARPLKFQFHGYYRARYNWIGNAPMPKRSQPGTPLRDFPSKNASYGYMRLRLDPEVTYGPNPDLPIARLRFTLDGLDNVVFGDNARVFSSPLFAVDQSLTDVNGFDLRESLKLERVWIEFLVPVGQVRVGRMESHWGMGQLTHAGNGLAEWGDFLRGETFDRIMFATRPMTIARGIREGDTQETPLFYAFVYDRLTQDPVVDATIPSPPAASNPNFKPFYTTFDERSTFPLAYLTNLDRRVNSITNVLAWFDDDYGNAATDELFAGVYVVYRWEPATDSGLIIPDAAWRLKHTLKNSKRRLALYTEGEWHSILGGSGALAFTGDCPPAPCNRGKAAIHNVMGRLGLGTEGKWGAYLESGWSSGDADLLSLFEDKPTLGGRSFNENIRVGLLMYQVALKALTYSSLAPLGATDLGANGSVWNSVYFLPVGRFTLIPGLELHAQVLVAWANKLDPLVFGLGNKNTQCGFSSDCFYGWEADLALRAKMGARDIVWIDLETGMMQPGKAFTNAGFNDAWLWTVQLRAAMIF